MNLVGNKNAELLVAADVIASTLAGATVHLGKTDVAIGRSTVKADLTAHEADYDGYAAQTITWNDPSYGDDGEVEVVGIVPEFRPDSADVDNQIYYLYILSAGSGTPLIFAARFDDPPLPMAEATDSLVVTVRWKPRTNGVVVTIS